MPADSRPPGGITFGSSFRQRSAYSPQCPSLKSPELKRRDLPPLVCDPPASAGGFYWGVVLRPIQARSPSKPAAQAREYGPPHGAWSRIPSLARRACMRAGRGPSHKSPERKRRDLRQAVRDPPAYAGGFYSDGLCGRDIDVCRVPESFQELLAVFPCQAEGPNVRCAESSDDGR